MGKPIGSKQPSHGGLVKLVQQVQSNAVNEHSKTVNRLNNFFDKTDLPKVFFRCEAQKLGRHDLRTVLGELTSVMICHSVAFAAVGLGEGRNNGVTLCLS
jgi:hypothetical protein